MKLAFTIALRNNDHEYASPIYLKAKEIASDVYESLKLEISRIEMEEKLIFDFTKKDFELTLFLNFFSPFIHVDFPIISSITKELERKHNIKISIVR